MYFLGHNQPSKLEETTFFDLVNKNDITTFNKHQRIIFVN